MGTELREQREADAKAEAEQRRREERRTEEGRVFARMMPDRCSSTVFAGWRGTTAIRWTIAGFVVLALGIFGSKLALEVLLQTQA